MVPPGILAKDARPWCSRFALDARCHRLGRFEWYDPTPDISDSATSKCQVPRTALNDFGILIHLCRGLLFHEATHSIFSVVNSPSGMGH